MFHLARVSPSAIQVQVDYPGSPRAKMAWEFPKEAACDISGFLVAVLAKGRELSHKEVTKGEKYFYIQE